MRTFKDNAGREWQICLTIGDAKRVRDLLGINLLEPEAGEPPLLTRLGTDEILLCDVIYCLIKPQADITKVSDEDFGKSLGGDAILAAQIAFTDEIADFFQKRGRTDRSKATKLQQEMIQKAVAIVQQKLDAIKPDAELAKIFGSSSTNSPA